MQELFRVCLASYKHDSLQAVAILGALRVMSVTRRNDVKLALSSASG